MSSLLTIPIRPFALLLLLLGFATALPAAVDPFYRQLYDDGRHAYARGDHVTAQRALRIACFGMLDDPDALADCLTRLALAQAAAGDREAFSATAQRIFEVERRFGAYSRLTLEGTVQQGFEVQLADWMPYETLKALPAFSAVARRQLEARLRALPDDERRRELERLVAAEPDDVTWLLMKAELELADDELADAAETAAAALSLGPESARARCLAARARLRLGDCRPLAELTACTDGLENLVEPRLRCLLAAGELTAADGLVSTLDRRERQRAPIRRLVRELRRAQKRAEKATPPPAVPTAPPDGGLPAEPAVEAVGDGAGPSDGEVTPDEDAVTAPPHPPAAATPSPAIDVEALREVLRSNDRAAIRAALEEARDAADRHPEDREVQYLSAELAYRLSSWSEAVEYFRRGGDGGPDRPEQQFYFAVALYETGEPQAAAEQLRRCLPRIEETGFVRGYVERILGGE